MRGKLLAALEALGHLEPQISGLKPSNSELEPRNIGGSWNADEFSPCRPILASLASHGSLPITSMLEPPISE